jgi:hypothetical protein
MISTLLPRDSDGLQNEASLDLSAPMVARNTPQAGAVRHIDHSIATIVASRLRASEMIARQGFSLYQKICHQSDHPVTR